LPCFCHWSMNKSCCKMGYFVLLRTCMLVSLSWCRNHNDPP
jgi:hypothetical protein